MLLYFLFSFLLGLVVGSFLNVIICRVQTGEKFLLSHSHCPSCHTQLAWNDLIPLVSFLLLRGRCRYCQKTISWQYPTVEAITGVLFSLSLFIVMKEFDLPPFSTLPPILSHVVLFPFLLRLGFFFFLSSLFIVIAAYDIKHNLILDEFVITGIIGTIIFYILLFLSGNLWLLETKQQIYWGFFSLPAFKIPSFLVQWLSWMLPLFAGVVAGGFFLFLVFATKGKGMGGGDVKLAFLLGFILGWPDILLGIMLAFLTGAMVSVILILSRKKRFGETIAFGPFLVLGALLTLFWGKDIIVWYMTYSLMGL